MQWLKLIVVALLMAAMPVTAAPKKSDSSKPAAKPAAKQVAKANTKAKSDSEKKPKQKAEAPKALPKLIDLGATTCIPCKMMTPVLDELKKENNGKLEVQFINVREDEKAVEKYKIKVIPTQIFLDVKGKELYRHQGFMPKKDIVAKFKEFGIKLAQ